MLWGVTFASVVTKLKTSWDWSPLDDANGCRQVGWLPKSFANNLRPFLGREVERLETLPGAGLFGEAGPAYILAPYAVDADQRTEVVGRLIRGLAENGAIPEESLGGELQVGRGRPGGAAG